MILRITFVFVLLTQGANAQSAASEEKWGVVLEHPQMQNVRVTKDVVYWTKEQSRLAIDIFLPPNSSGKLPCVVFFTEGNKSKSWEVYQTWPRLIACYGLAGIAVDVDPGNYRESVKKVFEFISLNADQYQIDATQLGVYLPTHIPEDAMNLLLRESAIKNLRSAVLFNSGAFLKGPFRQDLPVYYVTDDQLNYSPEFFSPIWNEIQKSKAPWTIRYGKNMPIFFEAFSATDDARRIIREAIYFWKNHLEPLPMPAEHASPDRDMIATLYRADYQSAAVQFNTWLKDHPDDQYALLKYAMISFLLKDYGQAELAYKRVKDLDAVYMIDLVKTLLALDKPSEADQVLAKAMATGKVRRDPLPGIGNFLTSLGKYDLALDYFNRALERQKDPALFYEIARVYVKLNQYDQAFEFLEKAVAGGYNNKNQFEKDQELAPLKSEKRWKDLISKLK